MKIKMLATEPYTCGIGIYSRNFIEGLRDFPQMVIKEVYYLSE
ncbi:hypothetical protein ES707_08727 [subsurface metagenome]